MALKTNYKDDILDLTQNANRKYEEIENQDGSISFNDVTIYEETGDTFGASDANAITRALTDTTRNISFQFGIDANGDYGYIKDGESSVTPFKTRHTETYKPTSRANNLDMGLYHTKRYVDTTAVPNANSTTYTATARGASIDMGATNTHRYVNTNGVPNSNSSTYSVTANGTHDMGATNTNRYVSVNVKPTTYQHVYTTSGSGTRGIFGASGTFTETFRPSEDMIVVCDHYYTDGTDFGGYASITGGATWSIPEDSNTKVSYIPANTNATLTVFANGGNTDRTGTFKGRIYRIL